MNKKFILKVLATILLFSFVLLKLDFSKVYEVMINSNIFLILLSLLFVPLLYSIRVIKWDTLLRSVGIQHDFFKLFRILLIGNFYGMITPGKAGEVARAYYLDSEKSKTIPTIIWDKVIDIFVLIILSILSILFLFKDNKLYLAAVFSLFIFIVLSAIFLNKKIISFLLSLMNLKISSSKQFIDTIHIIKSDIRLLSKLIILSICYYLINIILAVIILKALSNGANPYIAFTWLIIVLIGNIPITISGLGLREYIAIMSFKALGENAEIGFSFSTLLFLMITLFPGLIGYLFILRSGKEKKNTES